MKGLHNIGLFREACYINGLWVQADSGRRLAVVNPADNQVLGHVPECGHVDADRAIDAANAAWPAWRQLTAKERSNLLYTLANLIDHHKEDLARIMTLEQGKPFKEALGEVDYANSFVKWFAAEALRVYGDIIPAPKSGQHIFVLKQPIGVVAAITPWNFPAAMITRKIAPALAVGCTVVVKPAEETPFTALALGVLAEQAGFPAGVINIITGDPAGIGGAMTSNPLVRKISFTGSTEVGRLLMQQAAPTIKKLSLELGGNAPFIVFDDADLDAAVQGLMASKFRNTGQTCVCANRIFVQDTIYAEFTKRLIHAVQRLKVGNGFDAGVEQGPLINQAALEKVKTHIEDAVRKGGNIVCGGKSHALGGLFFEPTVLTEANANMQLFHEETFGPVAPLFRFHTDEEAIMLANDTIYGLASYFYSQQLQRIFYVAEKLEYGMVGINTGSLSTEVAPFGGIKQSGIGREGSKYGIEEYVEVKYLSVN